MPHKAKARKKLAAGEYGWPRGAGTQSATGQSLSAQGGVGPMTIAMLMKNTVEAASKACEKPTRQASSVVPEPIADTTGDAAQ